MLITCKVKNKVCLDLWLNEFWSILRIFALDLREAGGIARKL